MKKDYKPLEGLEAMRILNRLGYPVSSGDEKDRGVLGLLVAMAEEIHDLRLRVNFLEKK